MPTTIVLACYVAAFILWWGQYPKWTWVAPLAFVFGWHAAGLFKSLKR
jgi:hypothetical protein